MQIEGAIAVVTGAASGLGRGCVDMLHQHGARIAAIDLPGEPLQALDRLPNTCAIAGDVGSAADMEAAFARIEARWGTPQILINCAGVLGPARLFQRDKATGKAVPRPMAAFRRVIDINLTGTFNTIRLFVQSSARAQASQPSSDGAEHGVIVNTASVAAYEALSAQTAYGASKAGVASMTLPLARELARYGIRVVALAPGTFATGMVADIPEHTRRALIEDVPFPHRPGRPDEFAHMARAVIENSMMNGSVLRIDGAVRMREPMGPRHARATRSTPTQASTSLPPFSSSP
jgi:NAD(P)-dependent dehydrogenase (short-subunit alcohol dehydrogenase family)